MTIFTEQVERFKDVKRLQDHPTDTAKNFTIDGHQGVVSFITSMTEHFCAGCNRLRLLADGNFKVCLFGPSEVNYILAVKDLKCHLLCSSLELYYSMCYLQLSTFYNAGYL